MKFIRRISNFAEENEKKELNSSSYNENNSNNDEFDEHSDATENQNNFIKESEDVAKEYSKGNMETESSTKFLLPYDSYFRKFYGKDTKSVLENAIKSREQALRTVPEAEWSPENKSGISFEGETRISPEPWNQLVDKRIKTEENGYDNYEVPSSHYPDRVPVKLVSRKGNYIASSPMPLKVSHYNPLKHEVVVYNDEDDLSTNKEMDVINSYVDPKTNKRNTPSNTIIPVDLEHEVGHSVNHPSTRGGNRVKNTRQGLGIFIGNERYLDSNVELVNQMAMFRRNAYKNGMGLIKTPQEFRDALSKIKVRDEDGVGFYPDGSQLDPGMQRFLNYIRTEGKLDKVKRLEKVNPTIWEQLVINKGFSNPSNHSSNRLQRLYYGNMNRLA